MVSLRKAAIPSVGETVRVAWGLASVPGHVVEVYEGTRARVVVELDAGVVDDAATTVTVPLGAIEPIDDSDTPWAQGARYERAVANALRRMRNQFAHVDTGVADGGREIDVLVEAKDGRQVVIETKSQPLTPDKLLWASRQAATSAKALNAVWLVVAPGLLGANLTPSHNFAQWRDDSDDASLQESVLKALSAFDSDQP